jgi:hypothetical protein
MNRSNKRRLIARASSTCMTLSGARGEDRTLPVDLPRYLKETLNSRNKIKSARSIPGRALRLSR